MKRTALSAIALAALLSGCGTSQSASGYARQTASDSGGQEGVGDALGYALFGETIYIAKHPDSNMEYASESENTADESTLAIVDDSED